jgi:hypothetical protein
MAPRLAAVSMHPSRVRAHTGEAESALKDWE